MVVGRSELDGGRWGGGGGRKDMIVSLRPDRMDVLVGLTGHGKY